MSAIIWLRHDLRIADNDALLQACRNHKQVEAVVILTERQWQEHHWSPRRRDLYQRQLNFLGQDLAEQGIRLHVLRCERFTHTPAALLNFARQYKSCALYANREYPLDEVRRDRAVTSWLERHDIDCHWFDSNLLVRPEALRPAGKAYYQKFTPFLKAWLARIREQGIAAPQSLHGDRPPVSYQSVVLDGEKTGSSDWAGTETQVLERLSRFVREHIGDYHRQRDIPVLDTTSRLSPFFELGVIAPRASARLLQAQSPEFPYALGNGAATWLSELAWREFYQHLMYHVPRLSTGKAFLDYTDAYPWRYDKADFQRWCEGNTGFPIVDAGMRQLNATGWMHNRLRMIVASFLVKDLHIDWRWGERYFMANLIDGSFAANNGGWQWSASTGTDAVPYFRVFNPLRQSQQVDPDGKFIRKWVESLQDVPAQYIHQPYPYLTNTCSGVDYPVPMVEHKTARERFLITFKGLKK